MATTGNAKITSLAGQMVRHLYEGKKYQEASKRNRKQWPGTSELALDTPITKASELMEACGIGADALYATKAAWSDKTFNAICKVYGVDPDSECGKALRALNIKTFDQEFDKPPASSSQSTTSVALAWKAPATREIIGRLVKVRALVEAHGHADGQMTLASDVVEFVAVLEPGVDESRSAALRCSRIPDQRPTTKDGRLAGIELPRPESWNEGTLPWPLSLDIYLGCSEHGLFVKAASITFEMSGLACVDGYGDRTSWPGDLDVRKPNARPMPKGFRLEPSSGSTQSPQYALTSGKAPLGGFTAHQIIRVHNAVAGDRVTVRLRIAIADLVDVIEGEDEKH